MKIKYKIIEVNEEEYQIVVRFYTDKITESDLASIIDENGTIIRARTDMAINLPIPVPKDAELEDFILRHCPVEFFKLKESIKAAPNLKQDISTLREHLNQEVTKPPKLVKEVSESTTTVRPKNTFKPTSKIREF